MTDEKWVWPFMTQLDSIRIDSPGVNGFWRGPYKIMWSWMASHNIHMSQDSLWLYSSHLVSFGVNVGWRIYNVLWIFHLGGLLCVDGVLLISFLNLVCCRDWCSSNILVSLLVRTLEKRLYICIFTFVLIRDENIISFCNFWRRFQIWL